MLPGPQLLKRVPLRHVVLLLVLLATTVVAALFRPFGIGEFALLLGFFALVFLIESCVYVARRFLRGLRGRE